jgi:hypothetical protein
MTALLPDERPGAVIDTWYTGTDERRVMGARLVLLMTQQHDNP